MKKACFVISLVIYIILSCVSCSGFSKKALNDETRATLKEANRLAKSGHYDRASLIYQEIAKKEISPTKDKLLLRAFDLEIKSGNFNKSVSIAEQIDYLELNSRERVLFKLLFGRTEIELGHEQNAIKVLDSISLGLLTKAEQKLYRVLKIKAQKELGNTQAFVEERIQYGELLNQGEEYKRNNHLIAKTLSQLSPSMLRHYRNSATQSMRGWIDYTLIQQETIPQSSERENLLQRWRDQYPGHTAHYNEINVNDEVMTQNSALTQFSNIAVFLPHSGPYTAASHAIKQGMLTARDENQDNALPTIQFYDSTQNNIAKLYQDIVKEDIDFIIGPLEKELIQQLTDSVTFEKPTLTLNQLDKISKVNLYQIGLNPKDEIEQTAGLARIKDLNRALVFVPDTKYGERTRQIFVNYWESTSGVIVGTETYTSKTKDLSKAMSILLNLNESQNRHKRLQRLLGQIEFSPRPRHDADMIFIIARPKEARMIRPLLSFYRQAHLPVYTISKVYTGRPDPVKDRDLSGVNFCGYQSNFDTDLYQDQIEQASSYDVAERNIPLFNLGYDTYQMISNLSLLQQQPNERIEGKTGLLWLDGMNQIRRQLYCGQFDREGTVKLIGKGPDPEQFFAKDPYDEDNEVNKQPYQNIEHDKQWYQETFR